MLDAIAFGAFVVALLRPRHGRPREVLDWIKRAEAGATRDESQPFVLLVKDTANDFQAAIRRVRGD